MRGASPSLSKECQATKSTLSKLRSLDTFSAFVAMALVAPALQASHGQTPTRIRSWDLFYHLWSEFGEMSRSSLTWSPSRSSSSPPWSSPSLLLGAAAVPAAAEAGLQLCFHLELECTGCLAALLSSKQAPTAFSLYPDIASRPP